MTLGNNIKLSIKEIETEIPETKVLKNKMIKYVKWHVTSPMCWDQIQNIKEFINLPCIEATRDILIVQELGKSNNEHWHMIFTTNVTRNTLCKYLTIFGFHQCKFSDPSIKDYSRNGVGSEYVYLMKGLTNHLLMSDDCEVEPQIAFTNIKENQLLEYRNRYLEVLKDLKEKKASRVNYNKSVHIEIWNLHLKAISEKNIYDSKSIINYLLDWYEVPDNTFSKHNFSKWYQKMLKHCNIEQYREFLNKEITYLILNPLIMEN